MADAARIKHIKSLMADIHDEMFAICDTVSKELQALGRPDLNTKIARYTELSGQDLDCVYELHEAMFGTRASK